MSRAARWTHLPSPMQDVWAVAVDPADPDTLIAGTRPAGFWRSTDAGQTWSPLIAPGVIPVSDVNAGPTRVTQILFDPVDDGTVWAVGRDRRHLSQQGSRHDLGAQGEGPRLRRRARPRGDEAAGRRQGRAGDHQSRPASQRGQWRDLGRCRSSRRPGPIPARSCRAPTIRASCSSTNGNGPPGNDGFLLRSRDYGRTWENAKLPGPLESTVWCIATNAADPMLLFVCTNLGELFRSTDGGESWTRLPHLFGELRALHWRALAAGHAARRAFADAAGAEGRADGLGGGMSEATSRPLNVGLMVPANNTTMEVELAAWLPAGSTRDDGEDPARPGAADEGNDPGLSRQRHRAGAAAFRRRRLRSHRLWLHRRRLHLRSRRRRRTVRAC